MPKHIGRNPEIISYSHVKNAGLVSLSYEEAVTLADALNELHRPLRYIITRRSLVKRRAKSHELLYEKFVNFALSLQKLYDITKEK